MASTHSAGHADRCGEHAAAEQADCIASLAAWQNRAVAPVPLQGTSQHLPQHRPAAAAAYLQHAAHRRSLHLQHAAHRHSLHRPTRPTRWLTAISHSCTLLCWPTARLGPFSTAAGLSWYCRETQLAGAAKGGGRGSATPAPARSLASELVSREAGVQQPTSRTLGCTAPAGSRVAAHLAPRGHLVEAVRVAG